MSFKCVPAMEGKLGLYDPQLVVAPVLFDDGTGGVWCPMGCTCVSLGWVIRYTWVEIATSEEFIIPSIAS